MQLFEFNPPRDLLSNCVIEIDFFIDIEKKILMSQKFSKGWLLRQYQLSYHNADLDTAENDAWVYSRLRILRIELTRYPHPGVNLSV